VTDQEQAEDILQTSLIKAVEKFDTLRTMTAWCLVLQHPAQRHYRQLQA
jgi:hypothetical protein